MRRGVMDASSETTLSDSEAEGAIAYVGMGDPLA